ncbi:hypothetical protein EG328_007183, partial [Venturia inaequalis]
AQGFYGFQGQSQGQNTRQAQNIPPQPQGQQPIPQPGQNNYEGGIPYSLYNPPLAVRLGNLAKLYTEDMKYGGEEFESLKGKSIIFEDIATKVGITQM